MAKRDFFEVMKEMLKEGRDNFGPQMKEQLKGMAGHGAHELAAALFNGDGFVMYQRNGSNSVENQAKNAEVEKAEPEKEQERGGREM